MTGEVNRTRDMIETVLIVLTVFCIVSGFMSVYRQVTWEDDLCSGKPITVEKTDTIRTFSCTVELKSKDEK